jgi:hypothetical protein
MKNQSDCDLLLNDAEQVFGDIGKCFDTAFDERKTKMQVVGSLFGASKSLLKFGWNAGSCAVKHTPKAVATVVAAKRELTETITEEYYKYQKEQKEMELEAQIKRIAASAKKHR